MGAQLEPVKEEDNIRKNAQVIFSKILDASIFYSMFLLLSTKKTINIVRFNLKTN